ncbi:MAG: hypothetical protein MJ106_08050, partial [Lentisphaeria bacterium]|nr:hypothetical protein [Lentisphaeria bacterium]
MGEFMRVLLCMLILFCGVLFAQKIDLVRRGSDFVPSGDGGTAALVHAKSGTLELKTNFRQDGSARACWDLPFKYDLSTCAGVRVRVRCQNADLARQIDFFLHVDGVWYKAEFTPKTSGLWEEQVISKAAFVPEGKGGSSWSKCDRLRISAWRGSAGAFSLQLALCEFMQPNVSLALVRGGQKKEMSEDARKEALRYSRLLGETLAEGGIYPAVIDEADVTATTLRGYACAALPSGDSLDDGVVNQLCSYVRQGGKVGAFYTIPPRLSTAMRLPAGKFMRSSTLPQPVAQIKTAGGASFRHEILHLVGQFV